MFTILIQGPLRNQLSLEAIPFYKKYGKVIFVHYDYDDMREYEKLGVELLKIYEPITDNIFNFNNTFLQTNGVLNGLYKVTTEFTIKVRSDESFPNLDKFIENILQNPDKIHVTNLYSFKDEEHKFCLGNHIFAGKTSLMLNAFQWANDACMGKINNVQISDRLVYIDTDGNSIMMWSEILQTVSFLKALNVDVLASKSKEQIKNNFFMTPLNDFPNFKWTHKYNNYKPITQNTQMEYDPTWTISGGPSNRFMTNINEI